MASIFFAKPMIKLFYDHLCTYPDADFRADASGFAVAEALTDRIKVALLGVADIWGTVREIHKFCLCEVYKNTCQVWRGENNLLVCSDI